MRQICIVCLVALCCAGCTTQEINDSLNSFNNALKTVNNGINTLTTPKGNQQKNIVVSEKSETASDIYQEGEAVAPVSAPWKSSQTSGNQISEVQTSKQPTTVEDGDSLAPAASPWTK